MAGNKETSRERPGREGLPYLDLEAYRRERWAVHGHLCTQVRGTFSLAGSGLPKDSVVGTDGWYRGGEGRAGAAASAREELSKVGVRQPTGSTSVAAEERFPSGCQSFACLWSQRVAIVSQVLFFAPKVQNACPPGHQLRRWTGSCPSMKLHTSPSFSAC